MNDTFTCAVCHNTYDLVRDETWNDQKASEEFFNLYPECIDHQVDVICDDCNNEFRKWFVKLTGEEKLRMIEEHMKSI